jgi:hypothetical protein
MILSILKILRYTPCTRGVDMTYEKYRNSRYGNLMTSERYVNLMKIEWCGDLKIDREVQKPRDRRLAQKPGMLP